MHHVVHSYTCSLVTKQYVAHTLHKGVWCSWSRPPKTVLAQVGRGLVETNDLVAKFPLVNYNAGL